MLDGAIQGEWIGQKELEMLFTSGLVQRYLSATPIKHGGTLAYALARYDGIDSRLLLVRDRLGALAGNWEWLAKHYTEALRLIPAEYQRSTRHHLGKYLEPMKKGDVSRMQAFDLYAQEWNQANELERLNSIFATSK